MPRGEDLHSQIKSWRCTCLMKHHILLLCLCGGCKASTEVSRHFTNNSLLSWRDLFTWTFFKLFFFFLQYMPQIAHCEYSCQSWHHFPSHSLLSRSSWISSPPFCSSSPGRGNAGITAFREAGKDFYPVHNSLCCFHVPRMPLERKWNNCPACKKHALWHTFMIKLWSCCNEIFHQYIKTKQNLCGSKKILLSLLQPWFSFVEFI